MAFKIFAVVTIFFVLISFYSTVDCHEPKSGQLQVMSKDGIHDAMADYSRVHHRMMRKLTKPKHVGLNPETSEFRKKRQTQAELMKPKEETIYNGRTARGLFFKINGINKETIEDAGDKMNNRRVYGTTWIQLFFILFVNYYHRLLKNFSKIKV